MKKFSVIIFACIILLTSCSTSLNSVKIGLDINDGIYSLCANLPGFTSSNAANQFSYKLGTVDITLSICKNNPGTLESLKRAEAEELSENGIEYFQDSYTTVWDGIDQETGKWTNGTESTTKILFCINDYIIDASGRVFGEEVGVITFQLILDILQGKPVEGLVLVGKSLYAAINNGGINISVELAFEDALNYQDYKNDILNSDSLEICEEDNIKFYVWGIRERSPDDPHHRSLLCYTDSGILFLRSGIPYSQRNDFPNGSLDFFTLSLAKSIAEQLGMIIVTA